MLAVFLALALLIVGCEIALAVMRKIDLAAFASGALLLLPFGIASWRIARRLSRGGPGLALDERGITDDSTLAGKPKFVAWGDIVGVEPHWFFYNIIVLRLRRSTASDDTWRIGAGNLRIDDAALLVLLRRQWAHYDGDSPAQAPSPQ